MGIKADDRWRYLAITNGKANNAPLAGAHWGRLVSVPLGNGASDYPAGDEIQTVEHWTPPHSAPAAASDLARLQDAIRQRQVPPVSRRSPRIGWAFSWPICWAWTRGAGPTGNAARHRPTHGRGSGP